MGKEDGGDVRHLCLGLKIKKGLVSSSFCLADGPVRGGDELDSCSFTGVREMPFF